MAVSATASLIGTRPRGTRPRGTRPRGTRPRVPLGPHLRRLGLAAAIVAALAAAFALLPAQVHGQGFVGPKAYYLGLGDSLAFGYQPNFNWSNSYVQQFYNNLSAYQKAHGKGITQENYGCPGETSSTFVNGGCPDSFLRHIYYSGPQLSAAVSFLKAHAGQVSPVTLDIGANDVLPDISNCAVNANWSTNLATVDTNLTQTILPQLKAALNGTGDLIMMNYYDPYQDSCAGTAGWQTIVSDMATFNQHLAADAAGAGVPLVDVYTAFGGSATQNSCPYNSSTSYSWICSGYRDIHATTKGYGVIAGAFESVYAPY